jgi:hypothetical protein
MSHGRHHYLALVIVVVCLSWISLTVCPVLAVNITLAWDPSPRPRLSAVLRDGQRAV